MECSCWSFSSKYFYRRDQVYCATSSEKSATLPTSSRGIIISAKVSVKNCMRNLVTTACNTKVEKKNEKRSVIT